MSAWVPLLFFALVMSAVFLTGYFYLSRQAVASAGSLAEGDNRAWQEVVAGFLERAGGLVAKTGRAPESLRKNLFRAGYRSLTAVSVFAGLQVVTAAAFALVAGWAVGAARHDWSSALMPAIGAAGFGFLLPARILEYQVRERAQRIRTAVPPALDLLVLAMEAGQSLDQALTDTANSLRLVYPDLSSELVFCNLEMRAGTSRTEALRRLGERSGEEELKKLAVVLIDGERFGAALGPALRNHAKYLRTRMRQKAQEAARKLSVKLVLPVFFLIFPSVMLVTLGPAYLQLREFLNNFLNN